MEMSDAVDKSQMRVRYFVLFLTCVLMIGNYFCFDNPAALKTSLQARFHTVPKETFEFYFNMLYSIYSIPNVFLPFVGGILVDRLGVCNMLLLFSFIILVGQVIFALGCSMNSIHLMMVCIYVCMYISMYPCMYAYCMCVRVSVSYLSMTQLFFVFCIFR